MPSLLAIRRRQRDIFAMSVVAASLPLVFHGIVAGMAWLGDIDAAMLRPIERQNWLGSTLLLGIALGGHAIVGFLARTPAIMISWLGVKAAGVLFVTTACLSFCYGLVVVADVSVSLGAFGFASVLVLTAAVATYVVDMEIAEAVAREE